MDRPRPLVGVLAVQGAFAAHRQALAALGADTCEVRRAHELAAVDALVLPGGESTTMAMLLDRTGLREPLADRLAAGLPVFGTCAGMILLASEVLDGRADQWSFGTLDVAVRRNAYGRQLESFETDLGVAGLDGPFHAVFIRAPGIERVGDGVEVLASHDGAPVLVRQGAVLAAAFHPELTADGRIHGLFLRSLAEPLAGG